MLTRLRADLRAGGRVVIGFGSGRDDEFDDFFTDATAVGLVHELSLATWDLRPLTDDADFLVAIFSA